MTTTPHGKGSRGLCRGPQETSRRKGCDVAPIITALLTAGTTSLNGIARALNVHGVPTVTGKGQWDSSQVRRVLARL
jgi:hypothetical protein